jgi:hypothetical protein
MDHSGRWRASIAGIRQQDQCRRGWHGHLPAADQTDIGDPLVWDVEGGCSASHFTAIVTGDGGHTETGPGMPLDSEAHEAFEIKGGAQ